MVLDFPVFYADEVAAHGEVVGCEFHAYACGFQRAASFVNLVLVVS